MLKKLKNFLGIEGIKMNIQLDDPHEKHEGFVYGIIQMTTLSEQEVELIELSLIEKYERGRKDGKLIDEYLMGRVILNERFAITKGQQKDIKFQIPFKEQQSEMDKIAESGIFTRGLVAIAKKLKGVKSSYRIEAKAKVKGTSVNAFAKRDIIFEL